jgi:hypothetical protein
MAKSYNLAGGWKISSKKGRKEMAIPCLKYGTASEITLIDSLIPRLWCPHYQPATLRAREFEILHSLQKQHQFQLRLDTGLRDLTVAEATGVVSHKVAG